MQNALLKVEMVDTAELAVHPLAKKLPGWAKDDERFVALVTDIRERGIQTPLRVDAENRILDGREVWKAAKQLQLRTVPIVRETGDPATVILGGLVFRKHYTAGALAYVGFPLMETALKESRERRVRNVKNAEKNPDSALSALSNAEMLAERMGISRRLFFQARQLHELFEKSDRALGDWDAKHGKDGKDGKNRPDDLRARFEPAVLSGEMGLGAAIAGIGGLDATKGKPREDYGQLELFSEAWETLEKRFTYWNKFDEPTKNALAPKIRRIVKDMPPDLREQFAKALKEAQKTEN